MANGVIETSTGDLLRASYGTVSPAAGAGETARFDVPEPFKVRQPGVQDTYHNWNGVDWVEFANPGFKDPQLDVGTLIADADDLVIPGFDVTTKVIRIRGDVINRTITGIVPPAGAEVVPIEGESYFTVLLINYGVGSRNLVFPHESVSSSAANRFRCPGGATFTLQSETGVYLIYDPEDLRWRFASR